METIREKAKNYESKETKLISELEEVSTELEIQEVVYQDSDGKEFKVNEVMINEEKYRIPNSVLKQLKTLLEEKPDAVKFKVKKSGEGLKTQYQVMLLD